jgi:hypothetical protein
MCGDPVGTRQGGCGDTARTPLGRDSKDLQHGYPVRICVEEFSARTGKPHLWENLCCTLSRQSQLKKIDTTHRSPSRACCHQRQARLQDDIAGDALVLRHGHWSRTRFSRHGQLIRRFPGRLRFFDLFFTDINNLGAVALIVVIAEAAGMSLLAFLAEFSGHVVPSDGQ